MHNLRHFYYQNKEKIWKVVLLIAFFLSIIYFINSYESEEIMNDINDSKTNNIYSDDENKTYISNESAISGSKVTEEEAKKINNTINKFLQYCKTGEVQEAYNILSNDCKNNEYKTLEKFQEKYLKEKFSKDSIYEIKKWIKDTYKISIAEDPLSTGTINNNKRVEYITIVNEDGLEKLNINSFIGSEKLNKQSIQNNVRITTITKKTYMDYEIYDFVIENLSDKTIKINSLEKTGTMYLKDLNKNTYNAYGHEILEEELEIKSNTKTKLSIKYANEYSENTKIKQIVFDGIILDYAKYKKMDSKEQFTDICKIEINLYN